VSFLVTNQHLEKYDKEGIIAFILEFIQTIDKELSEIKLNINTQTRIAATCFLNGLAN
jgi:actin related protein 2/3 complex, subunit 4